MDKTEISILNIYTHNFVLKMWTQFFEALWSFKSPGWWFKSGCGRITGRRKKKDKYARREHMADSG